MRFMSRHSVRVLAQDVFRGIWPENPPLRMLIGMCPVLAITTAAINGLIMGMAVTGVLMVTALVVSSLRRVIPGDVRIPVFVVIIATAVTVADLLLAGLVPAVHEALGIFVPLIVVNCLILARAEAFASKQPVPRALADALGMGLGETWGLTLVAAIREMLGAGTLFGHRVTVGGFEPLRVFSLPPGAFLTLGVLVAGLNWAARLYQEAARRRAVRRASGEPALAGMPLAGGGGR